MIRHIAAAACTIAVATGAYGYHQVRDAVPHRAGHFPVASPDVHGSFPPAYLADAFGCAGDNVQPRLTWSAAPAATRSFAVTMYDPDAPTGSGFWHWLAWDLPATTDTAGSTLPSAAVTGTNDAGRTGYLGPCPPTGDIPHHYRLTVYALDVPTLSLPATTPPAVAMFTMSSHILASGAITVTARR
ncbi:hypothetical protein ACWT_4459 [Actinoplanes sp. SE50]|uniref:YbhB/YbcL family Raf kinase inhibitor-like protein n=1 Tax=unclassified Actinoplanes TaxID=2626549 RepID=UPI00023ECD0E|nr:MULTISPECIES: YbhB/YbcL family Raf kinase inhibitor-like protein [unclassified Actinoplanes]AEV85481.1 ybhB-like uncharacterized protein [Actinoplanes sp. SE50/110]ATO83874.1 hypothetical protein ACWT_4459 [Actinoplanes sp. SE50]SLM01284.1 putative kinase inhibitor [Actinoplanes sp. SE50/110]